jgi:hypothetical protein
MKKWRTKIEWTIFALILLNIGIALIYEGKPKSEKLSFTENMAQELKNPGQFQQDFVNE